LVALLQILPGINQDHEMSFGTCLAGVQLGDSPDGGALLLPQLVYASPKCTGN
jgi:hypothetical protein